MHKRLKEFLCFLCLFVADFLSPAKRLVPASIHAVVIREVRRVLDFTHPVLMRTVPLDSCGKARSKIAFWDPIPFAADFRAIDGVTPIVAWTILHELNKRVRLAQ